MVIEEIKRIDSRQKKLREFGFVVGGVLTALGVFLWLRGKTTFPYFLLPGIFLIVIGAVFPLALKPFQKAWMTLAVLMGWVMTRVLMTLLFFLAITPISLILRITGRDLLDTKLDVHAKSYWKIRPPISQTPSDYERQF